MNGAQSLTRTLVDAGVEVCFSNPGTSELHFVAALDSTPGMRCVLCLFEGVAAGAADGYGRMAGRPAATLLHLGPGLANAGANLHNAMRARTPIVNVVGDHATDHRHLDAPLTSDIEALARVWSVWVRTAKDARSVAQDAALAVQRARAVPGGIATLILPADAAWGEAAESAAYIPPPGPAVVDPQRIKNIAALIRRGEPTLLLLGGQAAASAAGVQAAARIAQLPGVTLMGETQAGKVERGAGRFALSLFPYSVPQAFKASEKFLHCICVDARPPVGFFAFPGYPGKMLPPQCEIHVLAHPADDAGQALLALADELGAAPRAMLAAPGTPALAEPHAPLTGGALGASLARLMPHDAILCDESITSARHILPALQHAAPHTALKLTGGAIGIGLPLSVGAAIACPSRRVVALQADGSGMYTLQALWTQARENLDITTIVLSNRSYAILRNEMANLKLDPLGPKALAMTALDAPALDWALLARGMGVEAARATTAGEFHDLLARALRRRGPFLIEAVLAD